MPRANGPRSTTGARRMRALVDELDDAAAGQRAVRDAAQAAGEALAAGRAVAEEPGTEVGGLRGAVAGDRDERRLGRAGLDGARPGEDRAHREQPDAVEGPHRGEAPVGGGGRARDRHPSPLGVLALHGHRAAGAAGEVPGQGHGHPDHRADPPAEVDRGGQQRAARGHGGDRHRRRSLGEAPPLPSACAAAGSASASSATAPARASRLRRFAMTRWRGSCMRDVDRCVRPTG